MFFIHATWITLFSLSESLWEKDVEIFFPEQIIVNLRLALWKWQAISHWEILKRHWYRFEKWCNKLKFVFLDKTIDSRCYMYERRCAHSIRKTPLFLKFSTFFPSATNKTHCYTEIYFAFFFLPYFSILQIIAINQTRHSDPRFHLMYIININIL